MKRHTIERLDYTLTAATIGGVWLIGALAAYGVGRALVRAVRP